MTVKHLESVVPRFDMNNTQVVPNILLEQLEVVRQAIRISSLVFENTQVR